MKNATDAWLYAVAERGRRRALLLGTQADEALTAGDGKRQRELLSERGSTLRVVKTAEKELTWRQGKSATRTTAAGT